MKQIKIISLSCASILLASMTLSASAAVPLPVGWYGEGNIGLPDVSHVDYAAGATNNTSGIAWNINVGYKFMPFFGLEGGYTNYGTTNADVNNTKVAKATSQSYDIAGKAMLPIQNSGFEFLAKIGVGRAKTHTTSTNPSYATAHGIAVNAGTQEDTTMFYGLGGEYAYTPEMLVNAQWMRSVGSSSHTGNLDLYSIGVSYLFG